MFFRKYIYDTGRKNIHGDRHKYKKQNRDIRRELHPKLRFRRGKIHTKGKTVDNSEKRRKRHTSLTIKRDGNHTLMGWRRHTSTIRGSKRSRADEETIIRRKQD